MAYSQVAMIDPPFTPQELDELEAFWLREDELTMQESDRSKLIRHIRALEHVISGT